MQIKSMTLESSTLQIRRPGYSEDLNIVICVAFSTLPFYAINMDADSSFLFLAIFIVSMYSINLNERISFLFVKKKKYD